MRDHVNDNKKKPTPNKNLTNNEIAIAAKNLTKVFEGGVVALEGASFNIERGRFVSLVGPSGCGKSTMLRLIAGLLDRTSGEIRVNGEDVIRPRGDVGMMFQSPTLLEWKTAFDNVLLPAKLKGTITEADRKEAMELLQLVGLTDFEFAFPKHLSGGMQQRVALARLLKIGARILLLDEPFGALDEFTRERLNLELLRIVSELKATSVFVTHNISEAIFLSDEVFVMTSRPGKLADIVRVPLPRPREIDVMRTQVFNELVFKVRGILGTDE